MARASEDRLKSGYRFSHPPPGEEIVISGLAGYYPESNSLKELQDNLFNKANLITNDDRRWKWFHPEIPHYMGKVDKLEKFDSDFFGVDYKFAHFMDPGTRLILERTYECIIDAGINPEELRGTRTGIYIACCGLDTDKNYNYEKHSINYNGLEGASRSNLAVLIADWLGVAGPVMVFDTACSSSMYTFDVAFRAIHDGHCDTAIIGGANLCLHPLVSLQFARLGIITVDGQCKCFDERANGYTRSEAIISCLLQKSKDARRAYMQVVYSKTNCDGFKEEGVTYPSGQMQSRLLKEFYEECGVPSTSIEYFEAHATGTSAGEPEELEGIDEVCCTGRSTPLLIGSSKTNYGHSETSSGLCSISKLCIAYNSGIIPPNINYKTPRQKVKGLIEGRLQVVTEKTPWNRTLSAMSGFGFGGANAHILFKNGVRPKVNNGLPADTLPRLVCVSGRTEAAVAKIFDDLESRTVDADEVRLWHAIHEKDIRGHYYRGYIILKSTLKKSVVVSRKIQRYSSKTRPVCFIYSDIGADWSHVIQLMEIPAFAEAITKCSKVLKSKGIDLREIIAKSPISGDNILHSLVAGTAVQIGLTDVLNTVAIKPDYIIGRGTGELICAYADGCWTAEQTILAAYSEALKIISKTASVGKIMNGGPKHTDCETAPLLKHRTQRWLTSGFKTSWNGHINDENNRTMKHQLTKEVTRQLPLDTIAIEIAPQCILQNARNKCLKNAVHINLWQSDEENKLHSVLASLGMLYQFGLNLHLANIYPNVLLPVPLGTPYLSHLVQWDHSVNWNLSPYHFGAENDVLEEIIKINLGTEENEYLHDHVVDGRFIFPGTGYLYLVWQTFCFMLKSKQHYVSIVFENLRFLRATTMSKKGELEFTVTIHRVSGEFELVESKTTIVTGRIYAKTDSGNDCCEVSHIQPTNPIEANESEIHMSTKDFYKELSLRGYGYRGLFQGVISTTINGSKSQLKWSNNWVTYLDSMLQLFILSFDSRNIYLPTRIEKITIDVDVHFKEIFKHSLIATESTLDASYDNYTRVIHSGGIEIRGMHAEALIKKPDSTLPILEKYEFIPNFDTKLRELDNIIHIGVQLVYENIYSNKIKVIEIADDDYLLNGYKSIITKVGKVLDDIPLVITELVLVCENSEVMPRNIRVQKKLEAGNDNAAIVIGSNLLQRTNVLKTNLSLIKSNGFIMSREKNEPHRSGAVDGSEIVFTHKTETEYLVLIKKASNTAFNKCVKVDDTFAWISEAKELISDGNEVLFYSQNDDINGLLGFVKCLQKEAGGEKIYGVLINDIPAPSFKLSLEFYQRQLRKRLSINVLKNGQWGTYRHLRLKKLDKHVLVPHASVNIKTTGDLSSLAWFEGNIKEDVYKGGSNSVLIHVYYSALNFRDVMVATGKVSVDAVAQGRLDQQCVLGIEMCGRTASGSRVAAMCKNGLSNKLVCQREALMPIPDEWTMEEGATVLGAYSTVYLSMVIMAKIRRGLSVLIHAGSGAVGQAAINLALSYECEIFTTVGTPEKRAFIKKLFPQINDSHIGNSRDTSFEEMVNRETKGRGVDIVLNSLADDKLMASGRCLAYRGRFLEIGKVDIFKNTLIDMHFFEKEISFHGVMLDYASDKIYRRIRQRLINLITVGIESGAVKPITHCTFNKDELETAFRYMASGKHIGKIIIKIRDEEPNATHVSPSPNQMQALPRYTCCEEFVYVVIGGLGGFGLEFTDWLVLRGARKIVIVSSRGIVDGYQYGRIRTWESYGCNIQISTHDITTESGCEELINMANSLGQVEAIFNLAANLKDGVFQSQTPENFRASYGPKAKAMVHLDKLTRNRCPRLKDFVCFSSLACGFGNAAQTNYGYSNSVMEKICERRRKEGLPGLAIQWGVVGEVGLMANLIGSINSDIVLAGSMPQKISSCLQTLDKLLKQEAAVVSSYVVASKETDDCNKKTAVDTVAKIIGIRSLKSISYQAPLADIGMDSIMAVEIKQTLERDFEIFLTPQEIRTLTFSRLIELSLTKEVAATSSNSSANGMDDVNLGLKFFVNMVGDEKTAHEPCVIMPTMAPHSMKTLFIVPGMQGSASEFEPLCSHLKVRACVLQLSMEPMENMMQITDKLYKLMKSLLKPNEEFSLLGYSFGTWPILNLASQLESDGHKGTIYCLDGSPSWIQALINSKFKLMSDQELHIELITVIYRIAAPDIVLPLEKLTKLDKFDDKLDYLINNVHVKSGYSNSFVKTILKTYYNRLIIANNDDISTIKKVQSPVILIRSENDINVATIGNDYDLNKYTHSTVTVYKVNANHTNIKESINTVDILNKLLDTV